MLMMPGLARIARFASMAAIALASATVASAQPGLTGRWHGETNAGAVLVLDLTVKGAALTGTLTRDDVSTTISEGTVSKNTFTFKAMLGEQLEAVSGELADNQIKVWLDRQGPSTAIVLTRMKNASHSGSGTRGSGLARVVASAP
jgi:hypothetical protein